MSKTGWRVALLAALTVSGLAGCSNGSPFNATLAKVEFETETVPAADAGVLYNQVIRFVTEGGAALPDRFELDTGVLPAGVTLVRDREDLDNDGVPDEDGAFTGFARVIGFPRDVGSFSFEVQAISTGQLGGSLEQPDLAVSRTFTITVGEGSVNVLNPTASEGTSDPAVPAFPSVIDFVNPANPQAFFSFAFVTAGGSRNNLLNVYMARELELSTFDTSIQGVADGVGIDVDESPETGNKFENDFNDGGLFVLQAGQGKVQIGGFQSPRGPVGTINRNAGGAGLLPDWFQTAAVPVNSRRNFADTAGLAGGDNTLGTPLPIQFSDYFSDLFEGTHPSFTPAPGSGLQRRKYPFQANQYQNAFFLPFVEGVDITPLRYRVILEAIDTRGTASKLDDVIFRKSYIIQVRIPQIAIDTVVLPAGQAGVDYNEFVTASGGVPPLTFDLEFVDGNPDGVANAGHPLDIDLLGMDLRPDSGMFVGVPRASSPAPAGGIELHVRVFASVMNPVQNGSSFIPTGNDREFDGLHPLTGFRGRHKTFQVNFDLPSAPTVANSGLNPGVDGQPFPTDRVRGSNGVPFLVPSPIEFPSSQVYVVLARNYEWSSTYQQDDSFGAPNPAAPGLPNGLQLAPNPLLVTNGQITGTPTDRGFHPTTFMGRDAYAGDGTAADAELNRQAFTRVLTVSISPDTAIYLRGTTAGESAGAAISGLEDSVAQLAEARMVPMFSQSSLHQVESGKASEFKSFLPANIDILPVLLANGGTDAHTLKTVPSISGFWPAEAGSELRWSATSTTAYAHLQQEFTWISAPTHNRRVFLWAETTVGKFNSNTSGGFSKRYQQYDTAGQRGIMIVDAVAGDYWMPAVLSNSKATSNTDGEQFGAEYVGNPNLNSTSLDFYHGVGYWKSFNRWVQDTPHDRELHNVGLGSYIEGFDSSTAIGANRTSQGRTGVSVAMSADGIWCATAMPGGSTGEKMLIWRTDKTPIPAAFDGNAHITILDGLDSNGDPLARTAMLVNLGSASFKTRTGTFTMDTSNNRLLPDSLMFVDGGIIFIEYFNLNRIFGMSMVDGTLTSSLTSSTARTSLNGGNFGPSPSSITGMWIPDNDYLRGFVVSPNVGTQFLAAGDKPEKGELGPDVIVFPVGSNQSTTTYAIDTNIGTIRQGITQAGNRDKSLLAFEFPGGSLDLTAATLKDLTGNDIDIYGEFLGAGRLGEGLSGIVVSDSGAYAAAVRDANITGSFQSLEAGWAAGSNTDSNWTPTDDLIVVALNGSDMDTGKGGTQHVLFVGTDLISLNGPNPSSIPGYASGRNLINARIRQVQQMVFGADERVLMFNYAGSNISTAAGQGFYNAQYHGGTTQIINNPVNTGGTFNELGQGAMLNLHFQFRNAATGGAINFTGGSSASILPNRLRTLTGIQAAGQASPNYSGTLDTVQNFWAMFKSPNGNFIYYISDQLSTSVGFQTTNRNFMVGFNTSTAPIGGHDPYEPFTPHTDTVGFEQFDVPSWNYESRFAATNGVVTFKGRSGGSILCVIASDASAGAGSATDLEVYGFNADTGGRMVALTSDITDGTSNAINYMYLSVDGNVLIGQRAAGVTSSRNSRVVLTGHNDLFCVNNVHEAVLDGAPAVGFIISKAQSHGSTVALVGEGTESGPQGVIFSSTVPAGTAHNWTGRTLRAAPLAEGAVPATIDGSRPSQINILAGTRRTNDDPTSEN